MSIKAFLAIHSKDAIPFRNWYFLESFSDLNWRKASCLTKNGTSHMLPLKRLGCKIQKRSLLLRLCFHTRQILDSNHDTLFHHENIRLCLWKLYWIGVGCSSKVGHFNWWWWIFALYRIEIDHDTIFYSGNRVRSIQVLKQFSGCKSTSIIHN